jgi:hypothetical protein
MKSSTVNPIQSIPLCACFEISREFGQLFAKSQGDLETVSTPAGLVYATVHDTK